MERADRRVLVLDKDALDRAFVESVLRPSGCLVTPAGDARAAVRWARENPGGLLLVDILLGAFEAVPRWQRRRTDPPSVTDVPPDDGYAALRPVDADPGLARFPVVFLREPEGAYPWSDAQRFAVVGYVRKPVKAETLVLRVAELASLREPEAAPPRDAAQAPSRREGTPGFDRLPAALRVALAVDPDAAFRTYLRGLLEPAGFAVHEAADGHAGLTAALARRPWLILTEANLPQLDGFEFCRRVRSHSLLRHTPVVFVSSWDDYDERCHGLNLGADDYFSKATPPQELLLRLQVLLSRYSELRARTRNDAGLEGGIDLIGATGMLQMCHLGRFTGTCTVRSADTWVQIRMRDGEILSARSPRVTGEEAIFDLLAWTRGRFEFVVGDPGPGDPLARFDYLLLEGCRRLDEARAAELEGEPEGGASRVN
jgi:DNA-binding response OmpR family regulator